MGWFRLPQAVVCLALVCALACHSQVKRAEAPHHDVPEVIEVPEVVAQEMLAEVGPGFDPLASREVSPIARGDDVGAALGIPAARWDMGEPTFLDDTLLKTLRSIHTDPGRIPNMQIEVDGQVHDLPLRHTAVKAEVTGVVARVEVRQRYQNPFEFPIETVYVFPLPENSAVDDMRMVIGTREIKAKIERRAEARHIYEEARSSGHTAALLEQERPNIFTQSVANIAPGSDIEVVVRYVQNLTYDGGEVEFVFPMVVGPRFVPGKKTDGAPSGDMAWIKDTDEVPDASRISPPIVGGGMRAGHDVSLELVAEVGLPVVGWDVPTHEVAGRQRGETGFEVRLTEKASLPNRDFVLRYRLGGDKPQATVLAHKVPGRDGAFQLMVQPPRLDLDKLVGAREIIFVVDVSGSMSGLPLVMCQDAMRGALRKLRPVDTFNVMTFANGTSKVFPSPRPANDTNIRRAMEAIGHFRAGGGTRMQGAIQSALSFDTASERHRYVFFMTDGYVGNEHAIMAATASFVQRAGDLGRRARVFSFGVGSSTNRALLEGIARAGDGLTFYSTAREDPRRGVSSFFKVIDHPVLTDVKVTWGGLAVRDVTPGESLDLFATRPLVLHGRYRQPGKGRVVISGKVGAQRVRIPVEVSLPKVESRHAALSTLWARARINDLERGLWEGHKPAIEKKITEIGIHHRIVTAYTSFVAVDRSQKVGGGAPMKIVQPVDAPEAVDPVRAGGAVLSGASGGCVGCNRARGFGTGSVSGAGRGGGGSSLGRIGGKGMGRGRMSGIRSSGPPEVGSGMASVSGSLDTTLVRRIVKRQHRLLKACYEKALLGDPTLQGKLAVKFVVGEQGRVISALLQTDTIKSEALSGCVLKTFKRMRFPTPSAGQMTIVYPLIFNKPE